MKIGQLQIGSGSRLGPLTLFPVWAEGRATVGLATGAAANLDVTELASGPQVGKLTVTNRDTKPVLLLEGELLEGGHQHRGRARDVILPAGETREVDTFCVEHGRWGGASAHNRSARRAPLNVRAELHRNDRGAETPGRVWERVARYQGLNTVSDSGSLVHHLDAGTQSGSPDLERLPLPIDGQRGVVVGFGGKALMLELFGSHKLFRSHYRSMVEAAWLDIQLYSDRASNAKTPAQSARDLAVRLMGADTGHLPHSGSLGSSGPVSFNGITFRTSPSNPAPAFAHLSGWDTRHPMMTG
ncbi:MAG: ARPP-1 family domain-containing protein [Actinomycetota bacterium]